MPTTDQLYEAGLALHKQGNLDAAGERYAAALDLDKAYAPALHMQGVVHLQQGNHAEAARLIRQAVAISPDDAAAHGNLVAALLPLNRLDEAVEMGRRAVRLNPESADVWSNLGLALARQGRAVEASEALSAALALKPDRAALHSVLAGCLRTLRRYDEAVKHHERAIELAPKRIEYRHGLAVTLAESGRTEDAVLIWQPLVASGGADPKIAVAYGQFLRRHGRIAEAVAVFERLGSDIGPSRLDKSLMFLRNYTTDASIESQVLQAVRAAELVAEGVPIFADHPNERDPNRRIRVGVISADFRQHAVGLFLIETLRALDSNVIELFAYSGMDQADDPLNADFRGFIKNWRNSFKVSDQDLAASIRADRIDILLDLAGPTTGSRSAVFAMKPAPLAAGWLGYSGTTGMAAIDYIIGDAEVLPEGVEQTTEEPVRLPDAYLCFAPQAEALGVNEAPALRNGYVTFGSLNNTNKLSPATLDTWAMILTAVPASRLALKTRRDSATDRARLVDEFVTRGIAADRIDVLDWVEAWLEHLPYYHQFDIGLDPFPYNGTTTTCEALHMGVPVLTLRGDRFISRVGATILHNTGLDDWIADDIASYVEKAVQFASDVPALAGLRQRLRPQFVASPMCDAPRFARNFETALRRMWQRWCQAQG
jgi:protein O-GlcNAc transferase